MGDRGHNRHGPKRGGRSCCAPFVGPGTPSNTMWPGLRSASVKWRFHPSNRLATIDMGQKLGGGGCALFSGGSWVPIEHKVAWAEAYLHTKWHQSIQPFGHNGHWPKIGGSVPLRGGELGPHLTQCRVGQGLSPYQVAS